MPRREKRFRERRAPGVAAGGGNGKEREKKTRREGWGVGGAGGEVLVAHLAQGECGTHAHDTRGAWCRN